MAARRTLNRMELRRAAESAGRGLRRHGGATSRAEKKEQSEDDKAAERRKEQGTRPNASPLGRRKRQP